MSENIAKEVVENELKDKVETLFAWFEPTPFASASMAQVHKVTLHSGKRVALKIQRAGIYDVIIEDIKVMYRIANVLQKRIPSLKSFDPIGLVKNFEDSILKELDFIHESINVQRFYNNLKNDDSLEQFAKAPEVYKEFTTSKVLALEFVSGIKIDKIEELRSKKIDTKVIARRLSISYFKQIFEYGFFHADPHPGNLLVLPNNHICYLDFGMMGSMLPRDISIFGKLFIAITNKDVKKIIRALQQLSNNAPILNMRDLEFDINEFVEKYYVRDVHKNEMSTILLELKDIIIAHGLKVPTHFFLFARSLVTIEGVIEKLDAGFEQFEIVKPYLRNSATQKYNPLKMGKKVVNSILELTNYMEEFPTDLKNAIRKINSGQIKVDLTHKGIDPMVHTLQRITKQLITAFIMVALIVGASLFIVFEINPLWNGISVLGISSFFIAIILGFGMLSNINKGDYDY
jgi:ubiquinone biosynthesis protein